MPGTILVTLDKLTVSHVYLVSPFWQIFFAISQRCYFICCEYTVPYANRMNSSCKWIFIDFILTDYTAQIQSVNIRHIAKCTVSIFSHSRNTTIGFSIKIVMVGLRFTIHCDDNLTTLRQVFSAPRIPAFLVAVADIL